MLQTLCALLQAWFVESFFVGVLPLFACCSVESLSLLHQSSGASVCLILSLGGLSSQRWCRMTCGYYGNSTLSLGKLVEWQPWTFLPLPYSSSSFSLSTSFIYIFWFSSPSQQSKGGEKEGKLLLRKGSHAPPADNAPFHCLILTISAGLVVSPFPVLPLKSEAVQWLRQAETLTQRVDTRVTLLLGPCHISPSLRPKYDPTQSLPHCQTMLIWDIKALLGSC